MRRMHGSMMDAVGARPDDLGRAQQRWFSPALPWAPVAHGWAVQSVAARMGRKQTAQALSASAALPTLAFDTTAWQEGVALAGAIAQQWLSLQSMWFDGVVEWAEEAGELRRANTVSKFVDQEMNLLQQGLALVANQATASARLGENIQSNLAYWLSRKAARAATPKSKPLERWENEGGALAPAPGGVTATSQVPN